MRLRKSTLLIVLASASIALLLFVTAMAVDRASEEKGRYIASSERLALLDFADAVEEMSKAAVAGDFVSLNHAAGKAEAYLSRAGIDNCGDVYGIIGGICEGAYGSETCARLLDAVKSAVGGDGGAALRALTENRKERCAVEEETTEDIFSARVLERIGRDKGDIAYNRAVAFACPNAVFEECGSAGGLVKFSGENIFVAVSRENSRVQMYCFDREVDGRYSITEEEAGRAVNSLIKREKLKLPETDITTFDDGIYRTVYTGEGEYSDIALVTIEVYGDTGRLRKYDAVNYYCRGR